MATLTTKDRTSGTRERDQADFEAVLPLLDGSARAWIAGSLETSGHGDAWVEALRAGA